MARSKIIWYTNNIMASTQPPCGDKLATYSKSSFLKTLKARKGQSCIITMVWENNLKGSFLYRF